MTSASDLPIILIVDDDLTNIRILAEVLNPFYRIKVANNGTDALEIALRDQPDLILLDVVMPEIDGFEVCRRLKDNPQTQKIAVIFVTAKDSSDDEEFGLNLGAVDYIAKPFVFSIIKARINTHVRLKKQADLLESLALLDGLTHISNRRRFDETLTTEWKRANREGTPLSLIMIDIDHFKQFNDCHGHSAGDICLQSVAAELSKALFRPGDMVARYGGEEFVVILPNTPLAAALNIAENLRERIEKLSLPHGKNATQLFVTISLGVATSTENVGYSSPKMLNEAADQALYKAKKGGRNRVCSPLEFA